MKRGVIIGMQLTERQEELLNEITFELRKSFPEISFVVCLDIVLEHFLAWYHTAPMSVTKFVEDKIKRKINGGK